MSEGRRDLRIWFTGCHTLFRDPRDNRITRLLGKRYNVIVDEEDPELLICSVFGNGWRDYRCKKMYYTGENSFPFRPFFSFSATHQRTDDYNIFRPLFLMYDEYYGDYRRMKEVAQREATRKDFEERAFCSFVVSNPKGILRNLFFERLSRYGHVSSGGRFMNNIGEALPMDGKDEFLRGFKFNICFENSSAGGYTTEKLIQAFAARTIPIYWGNPRVAEYFNPEAMINLRDFATFDSAIDYIAKVDSSPDLWLGHVNAGPFRGGAEPGEFSDEWFLDRFDERLGRARVKGKVGRLNPIFLSYMAFQNIWLKWAMHVTPRTFSEFLRNSPTRARKHGTGRKRSEDVRR